MVTRIDRLARSIGDLQDIVRALKVKGVALRATEQPIDTSTAAGKAFLYMLGVFARPTCARSGRWRGLRRPRLLASTRDVRRRLTALRCNSSRLKAGDRLRSPANSALPAHPFIGL
jgi:Resolvase, N terminal domain